jgi:RHS repeat-associated protein
VITTNIDYRYDPLYRLTAADYESGEFFQYSYDPVGNRLRQDTHNSTNLYAYDATNRLIEVDGLTYTWDANGNLIDNGDRTNAYDHANRLIALSDQNSVYSYEYNGLGDRLQQTVDEITTNYSLDLNTEFTQVLSNGIDTYLYCVNRIGEKGNNDWSYHLTDALGSVRQLLILDGSINLTQSFEPFGSMLSNAGYGSSRYGFTGEWTDGSGLVHLRARYYEPQNGMFFVKDPLPGDVQKPSTMNPYQYAADNPLINSDPSGQVCLAGFDVGPGFGSGIFRKCTDEDRRNAVEKIQFWSGFITSPNFVKGFTYELIDSVLVIGPEMSRLVINHMMEVSPALKNIAEMIAFQASVQCGNNTLIQFLSLIENGIQGDIYFTGGRVVGRIMALILAFSQVTISTTGALVAAAAGPFTFGFSLGGSAVAVGISVHGAAVIGNVAIKEINDHLVFNFITGRDGSVGGSGIPPTNPISKAKLPQRGRIRYVPPETWHPNEPLYRGPNSGYIDKFGNEWVKGPSRTAGDPFEWDVILSNQGKAQLGHLSRDGIHINVSLKGEITH